MYKEAGEAAGRVGSMIIGAVAPAGSKVKANVTGTGSIFGKKTPRKKEEEEEESIFGDFFKPKTITSQFGG